MSSHLNRSVKPCDARDRDGLHQLEDVHGVFVHLGVQLVPQGLHEGGRLRDGDLVELHQVGRRRVEQHRHVLGQVARYAVL